ncbi:CBS domain-containing protein [Candidatus Nitrospira salsa]|nr:MAG: CBS domain-containing protein [Nitrospirales bacterium]
MTMIKDIMTVEVDIIGPETNVQEAAGKMKQLNVGIMPICENHKIIGLLTDRDIILRVIAEKKDPAHTLARDVMTQDIIVAGEEQDVTEAQQLMSHHQIRRLPIVNRNNLFIGMLSLGDLTARSSAYRGGEVFEEVSQPSKPNR